MCADATAATFVVAVCVCELVTCDSSGETELGAVAMVAMQSVVLHGCEVHGISCEVCVRRQCGIIASTCSTSRGFNTAVFPLQLTTTSSKIPVWIWEK